MRKNINEKNINEKIIDQTIVVSSGISNTLVPCYLLSYINFYSPTNSLVNHKISPNIKNGVNIVNGLSVLNNAWRWQNKKIDLFFPSIHLIQIPLSGLLSLSNTANFMLNDNGTDGSSNNNLSFISYAGGMIVGNIIVNKFNKGSYIKA